VAGWEKVRGVLSYRLLVGAVFATTVVLLALVAGGWLLDAASGTFLAVVLYTTLTAILIIETREDRLSQRRPYVVVDVDDPSRHAREHAFGDHDSRLNIRNRGQAAAVDIKVTFDKPLTDVNGKPVVENPTLREGIRYLPPGQTMSLLLEDNFWFGIGIEAQPWRRPDDPVPPQNPATIKVTCSYHDPSTARRYAETYDLDVAPFVFGWKVSTD